MRSALAGSDECCDLPQRNAGGEEAEEPSIDPTLASCCQRDLRQQHRVTQAKAALLNVDRIDQRSRESRAVLGSQPPVQTEGLTSSDHDEDSGTDDGDSSLHIFRSSDPYPGRSRRQTHRKILVYA